VCVVLLLCVCLYQAHLLVHIQQYGGLCSVSDVYMSVHHVFVVADPHVKITFGSLMYGWITDY